MLKIGGFTFKSFFLIKSLLISTEQCVSLGLYEDLIDVYHFGIFDFETSSCNFHSVLVIIGTVY